MNIADWIIVLVLLLSVVQAASSGFFQEAFGIAGLVFGYLIAAWQYRHLSEHFAPYISSHWLSEILAFVYSGRAETLRAVADSARAEKQQREMDEARAFHEAQVEELKKQTFKEGRLLPSQDQSLLIQILKLKSMF